MLLTISFPEGNWIQLQFIKEELTCYNSKTLREIHGIAQSLKICSEKSLTHTNVLCAILKEKNNPDNL